MHFVKHRPAPPPRPETLAAQLDANRKAAERFKAAALAVDHSKLGEPRAPGKWSPAQVVEHVAIAHEVVRRVIRGEERLMDIPRFLRWIARAAYYSPILRNGAFPKSSRTTKEFIPADVPASREVLLKRLDAAVDALDKEVRDQDRIGKTHFEHTVFGTLALVDYIRFNELHTDHHCEQLPRGA